VDRELTPCGGIELNYDGIWSSPTKDADPRQPSESLKNHFTLNFVPNFNYPRQGYNNCRRYLLSIRLEKLELTFLTVQSRKASSLYKG
jgi:hypothetical protein